MSRAPIFATTRASVMLSAIVSRKTGQSLHSFLQERVFIPMGIYSAEWSYLPEKTPEGVPISFGGCGLSISMPDWAKFAQMLLDGGCWEGKQLLPPDWIAQATQKQIDNQNNDMDAWGDGYGYQIWLGPDNIYMFYGSYGSTFCVRLTKSCLC